MGSSIAKPHELVRIMMSRPYGALLASLSAAALLLASSDSFARPGGAPHGVVAAAAPPAAARPPIAPGARFRGRNNGFNTPWVYWPGGGGFVYDPYFRTDQRGLTAAELPAEDKNRLSHRGKALRRLKSLMAQARLVGFEETRIPKPESRRLRGSPNSETRIPE